MDESRWRVPHLQGRRADEVQHVKVSLCIRHDLEKDGAPSL